MACQKANPSVPIFMDGQLIGGADDLEAYFK